jgi:hypothetical protein
MSITQSTGATLVAMLGAVTTTANTLTRTVHTTASALDMLDQYVQDARVEQIARSIASRDTMLQRIHEDSAIENASRQADLQRKLSADPILGALFKENFQRFEDTTKQVIQTKLAQLDNRVATI